ncbi:hypothetical protein N431DRAFT_458175 [Stipitochalara longipes BDJ]|nr:hypothetical protein N431DRAFT_458175 [Stipitochalara longipes BDJ]
MAVPPKDTRPLDISILQVVEETSEAERTTHQAACHCGAVQFSVTLKWPFPKYPVNKCSCTICTQHGYLFVYPCRRDITFTKGYDNLGSHVFNTKTKPHKFCKTCGSSILADFERIKQGETDDPAGDILAVNVRTFKDVDLESLEYTFFDGRKYL